MLVLLQCGGRAVSTYTRHRDGETKALRTRERRGASEERGVYKEVRVVLARSLKQTQKERVALTPLSTLARAP